MFLRRLGLPPRLSKKELLQVLNTLYTYDALNAEIKNYKNCPEPCKWFRAFLYASNTIRLPVFLILPSTAYCRRRWHAPVAAGGQRDRADLRAVGQTAALELLGKEAAVEIFQPRQQDLRLIPAVKGCAGQMVDFCRTEPKRST